MMTASPSSSDASAHASPLHIPALQPHPLTRPRNIGIHAVEYYFPRHYVSQSKLEEFDGISKGKYTIGLGQEEMCCVDESEDAISICLTVTQMLLRNHKISPSQIGRLEVGSESNPDRSKSIKSHLNILFAPENPTISGIDSVNACYGGCAALHNAVCWMESGDWDGRLAIVVAGDIAVYAPNASVGACARCTGGVGACALLIGPDAPLTIERGTIANYHKHSLDFCKPNGASEYPLVDGRMSVDCYREALLACYTQHLAMIKRSNQNEDANHGPTIDHFVFHAPYAKLAQKAFKCIQDHHRRHQYYDLDAPNHSGSDGSPSYPPNMIEPTQMIPKKTGNSYCASIFAGLLSLLLELLDGDKSSDGRNPSVDLHRSRRIAIFSYGSGLASSMFSCILKRALPLNAAGLRARLSKKERAEVSPALYNEAMRARESLWSGSKAKGASDDDIFTLTCSAETGEYNCVFGGGWWEGTWVVDRIDAQHVRHYRQIS